jgi:hypothetical protein
LVAESTIRVDRAKEILNEWNQEVK